MVLQHCVLHNEQLQATEGIQNNKYSTISFIKSNFAVLLYISFSHFFQNKQILAI